MLELISAPNFDSSYPNVLEFNEFRHLGCFADTENVSNEIFRRIAQVTQVVNDFVGFVDLPLLTQFQQFCHFHWRRLITHLELDDHILTFCEE
jgi:hypothetical protein